jgi:hypothetical protein
MPLLSWPYATPLPLSPFHFSLHPQLRPKKKLK